jgi:integrase/recombinase XerC
MVDGYLMINSFLKYLRYEKRYSQHTITSYRTDLQQFSNFIKVRYANTEVHSADHKMIRDWLVTLVGEHMNPRSVNRKIASLRAYYRFLLRSEKITRDPTSKIRILKSSKNIPQFINESEIIRILDEHDYGDDFEAYRDKLMLELLYGTGIRLSELINICEKDINFYDESIKVLGKRNKERIIPLSQELTSLIKKYHIQKRKNFNINESDYLIVTNKGSKCYPMMVYRTVKKYLDIFTAIDKRSPHVLRHTFATHLLNKGADLNAVKDLLGHTSLAATQVYTHNSLEKLKKVFDQAHPKA